MKKILIMAGYFYPSVKAGGPIKSIENLVKKFSDKFDFYIVADDRDLGDKKPFKNIQTEKWVKISNVNIMYINRKKLTFRKIINLCNENKFHVMYLNSFFSFKYSILPTLLWNCNLINVKKVIVAPRGQFNKGALNIKSKYKKVYLFLAKFFSIYKNITWHSTNEIESRDIGQLIGDEVEVIIADNLVLFPDDKYENRLVKNIGELKIVYISRIHPIKNLLQALEILKEVKGKIHFSIYGPIEDDDYWLKCQSIIKNFNQNIKVKYHSEVKNKQVFSILKENHIFILLTHGENFGHAISEAFLAKRPVIISNLTPWRNLENYNAGFDISLNNNEKIIAALNYYLEMDQNTYNSHSDDSYKYIKNVTNTQQTLLNYEKLFE